MNKSMDINSLIIPVYINEKIVLDMLAIMEDGFSMVSQINYTEHKEGNTMQKGEASVSSSATILSKLLKIDISGKLSHNGSNGESENIAKEKVHTNVSLFSKFRNYLTKEKTLKTEFDVLQMRIGDFIEVEGELQKNPLINYMDSFVDFFHLKDILSIKAPVGSRTQVKDQKQQDNEIIKQMKLISEELKHSGTIDFILSDKSGTVVLSAQEQYLSNDNVSEILGGRFRVLGKVIAICKNQNESIDLLRKSTLSLIPQGIIEQSFSEPFGEVTKRLALPEFKTKIIGPAVIVIPIAIYA